ncbi:uncharacterized protein LOC121874352 isoform X3 [Homarus americanus]|uniref:uncharacterized protein LOC121874352 isoform X2 n=1 Tax=Homarus americanus TaxID=6706 RepID=UPI001C48B4AB|nr:uncharacterized protein LOC121874352 isoform X2 [Homarus americanus]XP_042234417.1 uncharacterized protein LOC121874352 isoform X3 [Homarus americanus]
MSEEISSVRPNPYIFDIENRRKRKPRLAHDLGAGAKCNKCGDKCPGFELHFWRKICMNCRCGKDDHEVEDDDEDIGRIVIGKLFDRPPRTKKEELEYCHGNNLDVVNEETGKTEKIKFDWVPPNIEKNLAARYMALLPPEKRPVAGSEAAKERRKQLEQQLPLYDVDEAQRCDNMPAEELQCFHAYLERIRTQVAGQGMVQEIVGVPTRSMAQSLLNQQLYESFPQDSGKNIDNTTNIGNHPDAFAGSPSVYGVTPDDHILRNKNQLHTDDEHYSQPFRQPGIQPDNKRSSLRDKFIGEMIGDYGDPVNFKGESVAKSEKYAVAPQTSQPLRGLGAGQDLDRIAAGLSDLDINRNQKMGATGQGGIPGHQYAGLGQKNTLPRPYNGNLPSYKVGQPGYMPGQEGYVPDNQGFRPVQEGYVPGQQGSMPGQEGYVPGQQGLGQGQQGYVPGQQGPMPGQEGYVPGQQGFLPSQGYVPGQKGYIPGQQGPMPGQKGYIPGQQGPMLGQEGYIPGQQGPMLGQEGYIPGQQGPMPGQEGYIPGQQGPMPGQEGYIPGQQGPMLGQEGYIPGQQGPMPGQEGYIPGQQGPMPGQEGYIPGQQGPMPGQEGYAPGKRGLLPVQQGYMPCKENNVSRQQAYTPNKETTIHGYQMGASETSKQLAGQEAGIPHLRSNIEGAQDVMPGQQGRMPLQQMKAKDGSVAAVEAMQAPYGARVDTLTGGMSVAPGTDVTVLFPGESQVLGSQIKYSDIPQKSKFSCQYCNLPMNVGDVAIFCERAGSEKCWHPACFCCYTCKELLADLIYFYKDGKVFCGRHFTDAADIPRCKACDELIFGNSWTRADGFDWHIHHFCCNVCDLPMAGQRYVPDKDGYPYCLQCYMSCLAKMCETCEEKIPPEENRCGHRGYFYHANPQCFRCHSCKEPLLGKKFKMSKNWLFCSNECIQAAAEDLANNPNPKEKPL